MYLILRKKAFKLLTIEYLCTALKISCFFIKGTVSVILILNIAIAPFTTGTLQKLCLIMHELELLVFKTVYFDLWFLCNKSYLRIFDWRNDHNQTFLDPEKLFYNLPHFCIFARKDN